MGTLIITAGVRIVNETYIKVWVQDAVDRVVDQAVANTRFMNITTLGISNDEVFIAAVSIELSHKVVVECQDVTHQARLEFEHIGPVTFATSEFCPGGKEIFN
jgi:hypothetical protein